MEKREPNSQIKTPPFNIILDLFVSLNFPCHLTSQLLQELFNRCHKVNLASSHPILHKMNLLETRCHSRIFIGAPQTQRKSPKSLAWSAKLFTVWISPMPPAKLPLPQWQTLCVIKTVNPLTLQSPLGYFLPFSPPPILLFVKVKHVLRVPC